jgi:hypothetical protein
MRREWETWVVLDSLAPSVHACVAGLLKGTFSMGGGGDPSSSSPTPAITQVVAITNGFLTLLSNMFTDLNLSDMETCYKAFRTEIIQSIPICEKRFGFEPEITAKVAKKNWRIYEVGISYYGRTYDEGKKIGWRDGVRAIWCILKYNLWA